MRMRARITVTATDAGARWARLDHAPMIRFTAWLHARPIGEIVVVSRGPSRGYVAWSLIEERYRGLGLGRKLYGEASRRVGVIYTSPGRSDAASRVWQSISRDAERRPGGWRFAEFDGGWAAALRCLQDVEAQS